MAVGIMVMIQSTWALSPEPAREGCRLWWSHQPKWLKNGLSYFHSGGSPDFIIYSPILTCPHTLKRIQVINILPHTKNFKSNPSHSGNKSTILETSSSNLYINKQKGLGNKKHNSKIKTLIRGEMRQGEAEVKFYGLNQLWFKLPHFFSFYKNI